MFLRSLNFSFTNKKITVINGRITAENVLELKERIFFSFQVFLSTEPLSFSQYLPKHTHCKSR